MRARPHWGEEAGFVGGFEVLPFGFLVFVAGTLLLVNAWAVVDAKLAAEAAAREATRSFVESPGPEVAAMAGAEHAAEDAIAGHGRDPARATVTVDGRAVLERCAPVTFVVTYRVPTLSVPWIGAFGDGVVTASGRHTEVVDPYRDGLPLGHGGTVRCDG